MPRLTGNAHFFDAVVAEGLTPAWNVLVLDLRRWGMSEKPETGYPPLISRDQAERTVAGFPDATLVDVPGNHMTGFFGVGAAQVARAIRTVLGR